MPSDDEDGSAYYLEVGSLSRTDSFVRSVFFKIGNTLLDRINQALEISPLKCIRKGSSSRVFNLNTYCLYAFAMCLK